MIIREFLGCQSIHVLSGRYVCTAAGSTYHRENRGEWGGLFREILAGSTKANMIFGATPVLVDFDLTGVTGGPVGAILPVPNYTKVAP